MRYLGIDYGSKRIGIAISDEEGRIAFPRVTFDGTDEKKALLEIQDIVKKEAISKIIIGIPISFGGQSTAQTKVVRQFGDTLSPLVQLPVEFENEILTSKMGRDAGIPKDRLDASAAAIILQSYLDKQNHS